MSESFMAQNTINVHDVMHLADLRGIPGLLLLMDMEKAFEGRAHSLFQCLKCFRFGPTFTRWTHAFYTTASFVWE